jgi:hypothetical protein
VLLAGVDGRLSKQNPDHQVNISGFATQGHFDDVKQGLELV